MKKLTQSYFAENNNRVNKWITLSLPVLNLYFSIRFIVLIFSQADQLNLQSIIGLSLLIIFLIVILFILGLSENINKLKATFFRKSFVFEIFVWFLVFDAVLQWIYKRLNTSAVIEIQGWFFTTAIWIVLTLILTKTAAHFPELLSSKRHQERRVKKPLLEIGILGCGLILLGYWLYSQFIIPLPYFYHFDPEYQYILTAMTPFQEGGLYKRMDHPGTLIQFFGSIIHIIINGRSIFKAGTSFYPFISHIEYYLYSVRFLLLLLSLYSFYKLSNLSISFKIPVDKLTGLAIPLVYFASHAISFEYMTIWSPNSFNFIFGTLIYLVLIINLRKNEELNPDLVKMAAVFAGLIGTFQVYMISWSIGIAISIFFFFLLRHNDIRKAFKMGSLSVLNSIKGYVIGTLVIVDSYESFLEWLLQLTTHQGLYGTGEPGFTSLKSFFTNMTELYVISEQIFIFGIILVAGIIYFLIKTRHKRRGLAGIWSLAIGLTLHLALQILVVGKHPRSRYLLSVAAILPSLFTVLVLLIKETSTNKKLILTSVSVVVIACFGLSTFRSISNHQERINQYQSYENTISTFIEDFAGARDINVDQVKKYWTYGSISACYSLYFGNGRADKAYLEQIELRCDAQNDYTYDIWSKKIVPFDPERQETFLDDQSIIIIAPKRYQEYGLNEFGILHNTDISELSFITSR